MHHNDPFILRTMGMGIGYGRLPVGCPAGVTDSAGTVYCISIVCHLFQRLKPSLCLQNFDPVLTVPYIGNGNAGRIISSVFQSGKTA